MKLISEHIRLLLYRNDCVVVPGLGGFILNRLPAALDEKEGKLYPPRSLPFFNKQLQSNDGLLAASLVKRQKIEYGEALQEIRRFVELVNESLEAGREYVLHGLGAFLPNEQGHITFTPDPECSISPDHFGLTGIGISELVKAKQISRKALAPVRKRRSTASWITIAACLAIIATGMWVVDSSINTPMGKQWSALNPFGDFWNNNTAPLPKAEPEPSTKTDLPDPVTDEPGAQTEAGTTETTDPQQEEADKISEQPEITPATAPDNAPEDEKPSAMSNRYTHTGTDSVYYVVVGAFKHPSYARRYEQKLKREGWSACTYDGDGSLIRVCAEKHIYRFEAEERLDFIRNSANPRAWILAVPVTND